MFGNKDISKLSFVSVSKLVLKWSHFHKSGFVGLSDSTFGKVLLDSLYFSGNDSPENFHW